MNTQRIATRIRLLTRDELRAKYGDTPPAYGVEPQEGTPYALERAPLLSPLGAPCNPPPWGTLAAIDLASGALRWEVPLGTTRDLAPWPLWLEHGDAEPRRAARHRERPRLHRRHDGLLPARLRRGDAARALEGRLPTAGHATPMTYRLRPDGRQYVVIAAGGHGILGTPPATPWSPSRCRSSPSERGRTWSVGNVTPTVSDVRGPSPFRRQPTSFETYSLGGGRSRSFAVSLVTVFSSSIARLCSFVIRP